MNHPTVIQCLFSLIEQSHQKLLALITRNPQVISLSQYKYSSYIKFAAVGYLIWIARKYASNYYMPRKRTIDKNTSTNTSVSILKPINHVLFFPDKANPCSKIIANIHRNTNNFNSLCTNSACRSLHGRDNESPSSFIQLLRILLSATKSIDLCIYLFTQPTLSDIVITLHRAGVKVRIITDEKEHEGISSKTRELIESGIPIKSNKKTSNALMHHKFVVIDDDLLLTGSFNWTAKAVTANYESIAITSESTLIELYKAEFDRLWKRFDFYMPPLKYL